MKAQWKIEGVYKADAQKVADEIGEGRITPKEVLEKAKDENSELHKCFEWNDSIAAEKYRLQQAGNILRMLVFTPKSAESPPLRIFHITEVRNVYQPTTMFLKNQDEYQSLLKRAINELNAFKQKYHTLSELEEIFKMIDEI